MQYLTYEEYTAIGGTAESTAFIRNIDRASAIIDLATHNRFKEIPKSAKCACRDIVEVFVSTSNIGNVKSRSQSAGNVSESETYDTSEDIKDKIEQILQDYLSCETVDGKPVLYRGALY